MTDKDLPENVTANNKNKKALEKAIDITLAPPELLVEKASQSTPFPVDALGPVAAAMVRAVHKQVQSPIEMCAVSVLGAMAIVAQPTIDVAPPWNPDAARPCSLFFMVSGASGDRKSETDRVVMKPFHVAEERLLIEFRDKQKKYLQEKRQHEKKPKKAADGANLDALDPEPVEPVLPMLLLEDFTSEGLITQLNNGNEALGIVTAEGGQLVGGHAMNRDNKLKTAAKLSKLWDAGSADMIRRADSIIVHGKRVSMVMMMQPGVVRQFMGDSILEDQGLLSRVLPCDNHSITGHRQSHVLTHDERQAITTFGKHIEKLLRIFTDEQSLAVSTRVLRASKSAAKLLMEFDNALEKRRTTEGQLGEILALANKLPEHALRIAGVLAYFDNPVCKEISVEVMQRAIRIANFFLGEALSLKHDSATNYYFELSQKLLKWLHTHERWKLQEYITVREISTYGPNAIRGMNAERIKTHLLSPLIDGGCLEPPAIVEIDGSRRLAYRVVHVVEGDLPDGETP